MRRSLRIALGLAAAFTPAVPLMASGDYGCEPTWSLFHRGYNRCGNRAVLSPGNDTRVNLLYLLRDRQGASSQGFTAPKREWSDRLLGASFFEWGDLRVVYYPPAGEPGTYPDHYGSRCISLASGTTAFTEALRANRQVPLAERGALEQAREGLARRCDAQGGSGLGAPSGVASAAGREFQTYLQAADAFYGEQWDAAREGFSRLRGSRDPWLAETAAYMLPRTELNAAQAASFDEYGSFAGPSQIDKAALVRAGTGLDGYLRAYPQGRYAGSAMGLKRRVLWLAGDAAGLTREYERLLGVVPAATGAASDLVEEIDNKLLLSPESRSAVDGPLLLATIDLMLMRPVEEGQPPAIGQMELAAQRSRFAGRDDLYGFVQANHAFYVRGDAREVLRLIPDDARRTSYPPLAFSRQVLRGMALAALKDRNEAGFWRELLGGAASLHQRPIVELGLAMNYERSGRLAEVFAANSPISDSSLREILLLNVAGPDVLRAQARSASRPKHERDVALFTLLSKQLRHGDYAGFLKDSAAIPAGSSTEGGLWDLRQQETIPLGLFRKGRWAEGHACPALAATAATLARDRSDPGALLCLGDFYRLNGFDELGSWPEPPATDQLGGTRTLFPGKAMARGAIYAAVIGDARATADHKAYALFRAINCYAPSGGNTCGGADVPESQRQAWFRRLKGEFGASRWARELRYYW